MSQENKALEIPGFSLPESPLLPASTRQALAAYRRLMQASVNQAASPPAADLDSRRRHERETYYQSVPYQRLRALYDVNVTLESIAGVTVETIVPNAGIAEHNQSRVLINLHGGNFEHGSQTTSQMESIPVAALGRITVISVDYRMAPEVQFPAATDDVEAVYRALLEQYSPATIGIFGSSAGAQLAGQLMVRLQETGQPLPAAIGLIAAGATKETGDSIPLVAAILQAAFGYGGLQESLKNAHYLKDADWDSPQVAPAQSDAAMAAFPPTLLASSTRDFLMSSVVATHSQLVRLGVPADLHLWEGLDHVFHYNPELAETTELHQVTVRFFERYLGKG